MEEIQAPRKIKIEENKRYLFLAGSIEMGIAENWQERVVKLLNDTDWVLLNPHRANWDSLWVQSIDNPQFREQVEWELEALTVADRIILYFNPITKSPVSLLELGLFARSGKMIVICPEGFWQKGNIDIVCMKYGIKQSDTIEEALQDLDGELPGYIKDIKDRLKRIKR